MKIGIYGGTFNPPHLGHLAAARTALDALKLDKLILMPAAVPPHKVLPENSPAQEHRLAMVERDGGCHGASRSCGSVHPGVGAGGEKLYL